MDRLRYNQIFIEDLDKLRGSNATAAPKTVKVLLERLFEMPEGASHKEIFNNRSSSPHAGSIADEVLLDEEDPKVQSMFAKEIAAEVTEVYSPRIVAHQNI
jgi:hypothetical protein